MFTGFTEETLEYFIRMMIDNTKSNHLANRTMYEEHVRAPLVALYKELLPSVTEHGLPLCTRLGRCVSGAYNDLRYCRENPVKTYMYLHFNSDTGREHNTPGLFFDASYNGFWYGIYLYHLSTAGMRTLRDAVLREEKRFLSLVSDLGNRYTLEGELYKKNRCPDKSDRLAPWLNRKRWTLMRGGPPEAMLVPDLAEELKTGFAELSDMFRFMEDALGETPQPKTGGL